MQTMCVFGFRVLLPLLVSASMGMAQVHYHPDGQPWKQTASAGPDAQVPGWFYNLGPTGIRAELMAEEPSHLLVRYVFPGSPADSMILPGDVIVGAGRAVFQTEHKNGYGMDRFGGEGPLMEFGQALQASLKESLGPEEPETFPRRGWLAIQLLREGERRMANLRLGSGRLAYAERFPVDCLASEQQLGRLLEYLISVQKPDGSWGNPVADTFAPLALLASDEPRHREAAYRNARWHGETTHSEDESWLINWRYMAASLVMSEVLHQAGDQALLPELEEVYRFLLSSQFTDPAQLDEKSRETHPHAVPKHALDSHGGWGHNPGFEGYGPIAMLTGQGALAFALMGKVGLTIDAERHRMAYAFLARSMGENGYTWYEDALGGDAHAYADMGRTGASAAAHALSPFPGHTQLAQRQGELIAKHPEPFPDTHGSPLMGMGYAALGAWRAGEKPYLALMAANRWWFTLAQCSDGTFAYQPNRDNAGYGPDARMTASATVAFVLSIPKANLLLTSR